MVNNPPAPARTTHSRRVFPPETFPEPQGTVDMEWLEKNTPASVVNRDWVMRHAPHGTDIEWIKKKSKQFSADGQESILDYYRRKYGDPIPSRGGKEKEKEEGKGGEQQKQGLAEDIDMEEESESNIGQERVISRLGPAIMVGMIPGAGGIWGKLHVEPRLELAEPEPERGLDPFYTGTTAEPERGLDPFYTGTTADALKKTVTRPATRFEELFMVYPVLQTVFQSLSTREVLKLCLTSVYLFRIIKGAFHVFSNHRTPYTGIVSNGIELTTRNLMFDFFDQQGELDRFLFSDVVEWSTIKHLVLDMTPLKLEILTAIAERSSLITLSVKYSTNLTLDDIQVLLDPDNSRRYDALYYTHLPNYNQSSQQLGPRKGLLDNLERLCIWGLQKTSWQYIPDSKYLTLDTRFHTRATRAYRFIVRYCEQRGINLDSVPCGKLNHHRSKCFGRKSVLRLWRSDPENEFFYEQPFSESSIWMCQKWKARCYVCGEVEEIAQCVYCDSLRQRMYQRGFCRPCGRYVCSKSECEGVQNMCTQCGKSCLKCRMAVHPHNTCTMCKEWKCKPHASNSLQEVCENCNYSRFCDNCRVEYTKDTEMSFCCICRRDVCDGCFTTTTFCDKCIHGICTTCREWKSSCGPKDWNKPNAKRIFKKFSLDHLPLASRYRGWYCNFCLDTLWEKLDIFKSFGRYPEGEYYDFVLDPESATEQEQEQEGGEGVEEVEEEEETDETDDDDDVMMDPEEISILIDKEPIRESDFHPHAPWNQAITDAEVEESMAHGRDGYEDDEYDGDEENEGDESDEGDDVSTDEGDTVSQDSFDDPSAPWNK